MDKDNLLKILEINHFSRHILESFKKVNREDFVPLNLKPFAYNDIALPLVSGSTISQPYTIAFMFELLDLKEGLKVLEIGSGSGYVLALLYEIVKCDVYGVEILEKLVSESINILNNSGIHIFCRDGKKGLKQFAPFDRILISAECSKFPDDLIEQLSDGGLIVFPFKGSIIQIKKRDGKLIEKKYDGFSFVPLV